MQPASTVIVKLTGSRSMLASRKPRRPGDRAPAPRPDTAQGHADPAGPTASLIRSNVSERSKVTFRIMARLRHFYAIKSKIDGRQLLAQPGSRKGQHMALRRARGACEACGAGRFFAISALVALLGFGALVATSVGCAARSAFSTLYDFHGGSDGANPASSLISDASGAFYGTTGYGGGTRCTTGTTQVIGCGTVFKLIPPTTSGGIWTETVLYRFTGGDGAYPFAPVILDASGALYGTAAGGGSANCTGGCGVVFRLTPPTVVGGAWTETTLYIFSGGSDGVPEWGDLRCLRRTLRHNN
jgi:hypothetical protein